MMTYYAATAFAILCCISWNSAFGFVHLDTNKLQSRPHATIGSLTSFQAASTTTTLPVEFDSLDVVLFGVGDLRTDDHEGLRKSLERASQLDSRVLPVVVLDEQSLSNIPGAVAHTVDTASMLTEALRDLKNSLEEKNLPLHVVWGSKTASDGLLEVLTPFLQAKQNIRVHACDHGDADNSMGYSPFANLNSLPTGVELHSWSCPLWEEPWAEVESLPEAYPDFAKKYRTEPRKPMSTKAAAVAGDLGIEIESFVTLPTSEELCSRMQKALSLDSERCRAEQNSGLFGTHWGGLDPSTMGESKVLESIRVYVEDCNESDEAFAKVPLECTRNSMSLEHATMVWNLRGDGSKESIPETNNLIAGERLTRYLTAPLFFGTLSPRRLWHSVKSSSPFFANPFRTLVETREWHTLLAARNLRTTKSENQEDNSLLQYKYWRWQGFLCRYAQADVTENEKAEKEGIILIHGFGASSSQWSGTIKELSKVVDRNSKIQCMAPDLIGFGQSEKPPITYCGFTWEAYMGDFIKEVAVSKSKWNSFVVGGNSIGGFVSICTAANDATTDSEVISGCGAPGTGRCNGAVLMNAAGVIQSRGDVAMIEEMGNGSLLKSVAQVTAMDALAPCK
jgi:hypothetical protein